MYAVLVRQIGKHISTRVIFHFFDNNRTYAKLDTRGFVIYQDFHSTERALLLLDPPLATSTVIGRSEVLMEPKPIVELHTI